MLWVLVTYMIWRNRKNRARYIRVLADTEPYSLRRLGQHMQVISLIYIMFAVII